MGSEGQSGLWGRLRDEVGRYGVLQRMENGVGPGTPDVAYTLKVPARPAASGWLELKHVHEWPRREGTCVLVPSLTLEQVLWLEAWTRAGGAADLLLQAGREYVLLDAAGTRALFERQLTRAGVLMAGHVHSDRGFPTRALVRWLTRYRAS